MRQNSLQFLHRTVNVYTTNTTLVTLQVSVALSFSLGDIRSAGSTEKNASFADELQIEFSTGVKQVSIEFCIAMANRYKLLCRVEHGALTLTDTLFLFLYLTLQARKVLKLQPSKENDLDSKSLLVVWRKMT